MNLAEMLTYADIYDLSKIANTYECQCNSHSKNELIQTILLTIGRREVVQNQVELMAVEELRFLNSLLFDQRTAYSLEELISRAKQSRFSDPLQDEEWNPRETITRFKSRGWLFNGYSMENKYLFHIPQDLKLRFSEVIGAHLQKKIVQTDEPTVYRDEHMLLIDDIHTFLLEVARTHQPLTHDQYLYKRQLQYILDQLSVHELPPHREAWRFGYGRKYKEYPSRFSLIYDYCYYNELIVENGTTLELTEQGMNRVREGKKASISDVYRFWLRIYKNAIPNLQSLAHWIERLSRDWITVASLEEALCPLIKPYYYDDPQAILTKRILQMMMHLGLLSMGEEESFGTVVKVSKLGSRVIQGNVVDEEDKIQLPEQGEPSY